MSEYQMMERKFLATTDALCENVSPAKCNCSMCPERELCEWLCANDPNLNRR